MTDERAGFEAKHYAMRKSKDGTIISFVVHPNDLTNELQCLPIGARVIIGWVQIADDETPMVEPEPSKEGKELITQCALTCKDMRFHTFLANRGWMEVVGEDTASERVRKLLGVQSRGELGKNEVAQRKWKMLHADFRNYLADEQYKESAR